MICRIRAIVLRKDEDALVGVAMVNPLSAT